jgi:hypothetical protein
MRTTTSKSIMIAAVLAVGVPASAPIAATEESTASDKEKSERDPEAIAALDKMGAFLRDQQSFSVRTTKETDYVLDSGQKVRLSEDGQLRVRRPDHLRADVKSDRKERQLFYDGKTFTIFSPRLGFYASVPTQATLGKLADTLEDRFGLELPMVDLFRWGTFGASADEITSAIHVTTTKIDGVETDQYAFRQPGLDWQIWIDRGAAPLPRKLVLTTTDDPARPELAIDMKWDLDTKPDDSVFAFVPPKDSHKIALAELGHPPGEAIKRPAHR